jgi:phospholipase/carboxylesterase
MSDAVIDDIVALLPPLLRALDSLNLVARHLDPMRLDAVLGSIGTPDAALRTAMDRLGEWPDSFSTVRAHLAASAEEALAAFAGVRAALEGQGDLRSVFRAMRHAPRAQEALYPLARSLPPVSQFFLDPALREDAALLARLAAVAPRDDVGVMHIDNDFGDRGGFSLYVPEDYSPERPLPLVMALHGGAGHGRAFLWSWIAHARSRGAIVAAPTATGGTWALMGDDADTPNLGRILDRIRSRWSIDPARLLLTGMSDGGTFTYVSGLEPRSPFTHLAPVSASFHPMLAEMADGERLRGLPIYLVHGRRDWMFPVEVARQAEQALSLRGARVTYREIADLSHCYPREENAAMLAWMGAA